MSEETMMYIYKTHSNKYEIRYRTGGKKRYFGTYLTLSEAQEAVDQLIKDGVITPKYLDPTRYITKRNKKYRLRKVINGKEYYQSFNTLEEAIKHRDYMESINWGKTIEEKPRTRENYTGIKYIHKVPSMKYVLQRNGVHYGTYNTIIDAVKDKLFWESINWDMDQLDNY